MKQYSAATGQKCNSAGKKNLDYITAKLMLEENFVERIAAHTCTAGGRDSKMKLSQKWTQRQADYFVMKGLSRDRLISRDNSSTDKLVSSEKEQGHNQNERVEFRIIFRAK
jgi:outer membrane protein OmpA-like peptidoglycan-associated protein